MQRSCPEDVTLSCAKAIVIFGTTSAIDRYIKPNLFERLIPAIQEEEKLAEEIIKKISEKPMNYPIRYPTLLCFCATSSKEIQAKARNVLERIYQIRRSNFRGRENILKDISKRVNFLPEYILVHLVFLLAHHKDYDNASSYLKFALRVLSDDKESVPPLLHLIDLMETAEDAADPKSNKTKKLAVLARAELTSKSKSETPAVPAEVLAEWTLPTKLFTPPPEVNE